MKEHSVNSGLPRAENFFTRKFIQPAFEFLECQELAAIPSSPAQANQITPDTKQTATRGERFFYYPHKTLFLEKQRQNMRGNMV